MVKLKLSCIIYNVIRCDANRFFQSGTFRIESLNHQKKIDISSSTVFNPKKKNNIHSDIRKFHSHQFLWNITSMGVKLGKLPVIRKAWRSLVHVKLPQSQNSDLQFLYMYILVGGWAYPSEKWWSESQLGWLVHSQYMEKYKFHDPNHQPYIYIYIVYIYIQYIYIYIQYIYIYNIYIYIYNINGLVQGNILQEPPKKKHGKHSGFRWRCSLPLIYDDIWGWVKSQQMTYYDHMTGRINIH